jgi:hypothetical protein
MKFVYHDTGDWVRSNADTAATRTDARVEEYADLDQIDSAFVRNTFAWMMDEGLWVTQCGTSVFQIRAN